MTRRRQLHSCYLQPTSPFVIPMCLTNDRMVVMQTPAKGIKFLPVYVLVPASQVLRRHGWVPSQFAEVAIWLHQVLLMVLLGCGLWKMGTKVFGPFRVFPW